MEKITRENLYHNLRFDWDAVLNELHGEDLWDTPNTNSREVRKKVVSECIGISEAIKKLPFWIRLFNLF